MPLQEIYGPRLRSEVSIPVSCVVCTQACCSNNVMQQDWHCLGGYTESRM